MSKDAFDLFFPVCNILVEARVIAHGLGGFRSDAVNPLDDVDSEYHGEHYSVALRGQCNGPFRVRWSKRFAPSGPGLATPLPWSYRKDFRPATGE